jgi:hypothetical protein
MIYIVLGNFFSASSGDHGFVHDFLQKSYTTDKHHPCHSKIKDPNHGAGLIITPRR